MEEVVVEEDGGYIHHAPAERDVRHQPDQCPQDPGDSRYMRRYIPFCCRFHLIGRTSAFTLAPLAARSGGTPCSVLFHVPYLLMM